MHLTDLDYVAVHGKTPLHRASPTSKMVFAGAAVAANLLARRPERLAIIFVLLLLSLLASGLKLRTTLHLLATPSLFAVLFGLAVKGLAPVARCAIMLRAVGTAEALLLLTSTTSVFDLTAHLGRMISPVIADALLMTCRSLFLLADRLAMLVLALRIKGTTTPRRAMANAGLLGGALGAALIRALDMSERMRSILALRGYASGDSAPPRRSATIWDVMPPVAGALLLGVALW